jgi:tetratricopeptide (TPR) repeat protein
VKRFGSKWVTAVTLMVIMFMVPTQAMAEGSHQGYIYDSLNNTPLSINGYLYRDSIDGHELPTGPFKKPEDIYVADNDTFYIVDGGNNRVIHMDQSKQILRIYGDKEGKGKLNGPKGVFVTNQGLVYVADTKNRRIVVYEQNGGFLKEFAAPQSPLLGKDFIYSPARLVVDKRNYMFVVSEGAYQGLMQIDPNGDFKGFFGANHIGFSLERLIVNFLATQEQKDQMAKAKPPEFSNLVQDQKGFIYTTTFGISYNQIKRLSAVGVDTLNPGGARNMYGDLYMPRQNWQRLFPSFVDVTVSDQGIITALDQITGKVFQYDKLGHLLFIFGGLGNQNGLFTTPASIDQTSDGTIYVVDRNRGRIDRFRTTPFSDKVHEATALYVEGRYEEARKPWQEVLDMNSNYDMAYRAIGKALLKADRYYEAMKYFEIAKARDDYAEAFEEYRKEYMREHFSAIVAGVFVFYLLIKFSFRWYRKRYKVKKQDPYSLAKGGTIR